MKLLPPLLAVLALSACGKSQTPADPVHAAAAQTCKTIIESRAVNRKTLVYRSVAVTPAAAPATQGQWNVAIAFSARNEIGMAAAMMANCTVSADGKTLVSMFANERR